MRGLFFIILKGRFGVLDLCLSEGDSEKSECFVSVCVKKRRRKV